MLGWNDFRLKVWSWVTNSGCGLVEVSWVWVNHMHPVSERSKKAERREGWADIFTGKGSEKRWQAKVKKTQKNACVCSSVPVCVSAENFLAFSWGHVLYRGFQDPSESLSLLYVDTIAHTQVVQSEAMPVTQQRHYRTRCSMYLSQHLWSSPALDQHRH